MDEQRHLNLLEAYVDQRLSADERQELEQLLISSASVRTLFWEYMQQHAFTFEMMSEAKGKIIALAEAGTRGVASASLAGGAGKGAAVGILTAGSRTKTGRQAATRRAARAPMSSGNWIFWSSVAAVVLVVAGLGGWYYSNRPVATQLPAAVASIATIKTAGDAGGYLIRNGMSDPIAANMTLLPGDLVQVNPAGKDVAGAEVSYTDGSSLKLLPGAQLLFVPANAGKQLELQAGGIEAEVTPQPEHKPMSLQTPHASAIVVGTHFTLSVSGSATRLQVAKGHVQLLRASDRQSVEVLQGQYAVASAGVELVARLVEEPKPPVVETKPVETKPRNGDALAEDEVAGSVVSVAAAGTGFEFKVSRAGKTQMIGETLTFSASWTKIDGKDVAKEAEVRQIRELRPGDVLRIHYFFEEHYRFRSIVVVERSHRPDGPAREVPAQPAKPELKDGKPGDGPPAVTPHHD